MKLINRRKRVFDFGFWGFTSIALLLIILIVPEYAQARNPYRKAFFQAYPSAKNSVLDDVPSHSGHCGVCHYDFGGGGLKNAFGTAVEATDCSKTAILGLGSSDSDGDGFPDDALLL